MKKLVLVLSAVGLGLSSHSAHAADGAYSAVLHPGDYLFLGQSLFSDNCQTHLEMTVANSYPPRGQLRLIDGASEKVLWTASQSSNTPAGWATYQYDGNFVLYTQGNQPLWSTGTSQGGVYGAELWLRDDAQLANLWWNEEVAVWTSPNAANDRIDFSGCGASQVTHVQMDTDFPGGDYLHYAAADWQQCAQACVNGYGTDSSSPCYAFSYTTGGECWLKSSAPYGVYANSSVTSGWIATLGATQLQTSP